MDATSFRIAVIAFESQSGDDACNRTRIIGKLAEAAREGVQLALFPQSGIGAPEDDAIAAAVEQTGVAAGVGWIERTDDGRRYESYAIRSPGGARVHILIGEDNDVVESVRTMALTGATLLVAPKRGDRPHRAPLAPNTERAMPRGSLPLSFAIIGRNRATG
ncbi:hypothetical protein AWB80_03417 [Caballeronia pedi]|uniref:CN hydrolase domain-containing protein n=1 Tax=Caballeronia pedi TaxID=1777141 RepID=A0A158BF60_9BURK|nr:hypothetical protein [Caballeronia pedi]SAK68426.1 hypothetical protein AWB80_03417 [Caballeronia pedi]